MDRIRELELFKSEINLTEFAAAELGYELDRRHSSRSCAVMRHSSDAKIVITRVSSSGHWIYFSVADDHDNGTIIDLLQRRRGLNLGQVRKALRPWIGEGAVQHPRPIAGSFAPRLDPVPRDRQAVLQAFSRLRECDVHPYLLARGIPADVQASPCFAGCFRLDPRGNVVFPHHDEVGLCGFERKNRGFAGFSEGGVRGLWTSNPPAGMRALVIGEAVIDLLSFHVLHPDPGAWYVATSGSWGPKTGELLRAAIQRVPSGGLVKLAFDNDAQGDRYSETLQQLCQEEERACVRVLPPARDTDWNDHLRSLHTHER